MLRLVGRYVFREIVSSAILGTLLATFVVFLQKLDRLFQVLVGSNASMRTILELFLWAMPPVLPLTIPFGVLVGILIGLGRLASDGEIIAMRAAGVSSRKVIFPVLLFASIGMGVAAFSSLRLSPMAFRISTQILNGLEATKISADIEPRVFNENFPNHILYVGEVTASANRGQATWQPIFNADVTPADQRTGAQQKVEGPIVTIAHDAIAVTESKFHRIQLLMKNVATYEMGKDTVNNGSSAVRTSQVLEASPPKQESLERAYAINTRTLMAYPKDKNHLQDWIEMKVELHKRFAFPVACLVLALIGIPIGVTTRKGGKSAGYVNAIFLAFICYYVAWMWLSNMARKGILPIPVAAWLPNVVLGFVGIIFLIRMERPGDSDILGSVKGIFLSIYERFKRFGRKDKPSPAAEPARGVSFRIPLLPQIIDTYMLSSFIFYLILVLAGLVSLILMYQFFELMADALHRSTFGTLITFLFFLTPKLIYDTLPIAVLVAVLANFAVLSKQNEIIAFKACGVSLYRLALPVLLGSTLCSVGLFAFDYSYLPAANAKQDALHDKIIGRAKQTYLRTDHKWVMGRGSRIYYYDFFDTTNNVMNGVRVFELEPSTFTMTREISAARAIWRPELHTWIFEDGWSCVFQGLTCGRNSFAGKTETFSELTEQPDYFQPEDVEGKQMNFMQLESYIRDLKQHGYNTTKFEVQLHRKFAIPLFAMILAMIAVPFGFLVGNRGAMTGIGVSLIIGIAYRGIEPLFAKIGDAGLLQPAVAAWSPDIVFTLVGLYFLMRMRS